MYCPECRVEYREGATQCSDCQVPLLAGTPPPPPKSDSDPDLKLVVILETDDPFALALAKEALEEAGIPYYGLNQIATLMNDIDPMLRKWVRLQVACDREAEARALLAPLTAIAPSSES